MIKYEQFHCVDTEGKNWYRKLEFYEQPFVDYYKWRIYHFWDMHFQRLHKMVAKFVEWRHDRKCDGGMWDCHHLPYQANQDCKCFYLGRKNRKVLFEVDITDEQGELLK